MSVNGSRHLGPDETIKREQAERLLADLYDIVVLLVGINANKLLPHLLHIPYFPHNLPNDLVAQDLSKLGIVHDSTIAWATEVLEYTGVPQPRRSAGQAVPVFDFTRLTELSRSNSGVRTAVADAGVSADEAARQLASISPDDPAAQERARQVLGRMVRELIAASAKLMRLDAKDRAVRVKHSRQARMSQPAPAEVTRAPLPRAGLSGRPRRPRLLPGQRFLYDVAPFQAPKQVVGTSASTPASNQGPRAPGAR
jgi:hypothetical protein